MIDTVNFNLNIKGSDIVLLFVTALALLIFNIIYFNNPENFNEATLVQNTQAVILGLITISAFYRSTQKQWSTYKGLIRLFGCFALFLFFEEIDYGQQLLGYNSPKFFLDHAFQSEFSLHHLAAGIVEIPVHLLLGCIAGIGIIKWQGYYKLPVIGRLPKLSKIKYSIIMTMVLYYIAISITCNGMPFFEYQLTLANVEQHANVFRHLYYQEVLETTEYIIALLIINTRVKQL